MSRSMSSCSPIATQTAVSASAKTFSSTDCPPPAYAARIVAQARIRQKDSVYRIEEPLTGQCIRLHCEATSLRESPHITARLTRPALATWFRTYAQAAEAFGLYLRGQPLEIVRSDA